jgi:hypothetical protein
MFSLLRPALVLCCVFASGLATQAPAQSLLSPTSLPLDSLAEFKPSGSNWQLAGGIGGDPRREPLLTPVAGRGVLVNIPTGMAHDSLATTWEHSDLELDLDFLLPPGSHAGLLLQGRYSLDFAEGGRAAGLWQHLHLEFEAPRFDAAGVKTKNARFTKIVFNNFVTGENVEIAGRTLATAPAGERPFGPLVFTAEGSGVALRGIKYKRFDPALRVGVENLSYKLYPGEFSQVGSYESSPPKSAGVPESFAADAVLKTGKFALVLAGTFVVPRDGAYAFTAETQEPIQLLVDGQAALKPLAQSGLPVALNLSAGKHSFRLDFLHTNSRPPGFALSVEGPGLAPQLLTASRAARGRDNRPRTPLLIEPGDRVRLQRSFVPYEPKKRLYAINVGTPARIHYAYDFETGAILRGWRGRFLDLFEMWDGRGDNQIAKPMGPSLTFNAKPVVALLERTADRTVNDWPDAPEALWSSQGYELEPDGQPVFLGKLASLGVRDRIAATPDGRGLTRTLNLSGRNTDWETWVLLAEAESVTPQPGGSGYIVGDRSYYIDLPADSAVQPIVRTRNGRQQLVVAVPSNAITKPIVYTLVW